MNDPTTDQPAMPPVVDRSTFDAHLATLRAREKAHTREGDAIAAARRRLPMVEVDPTTPLLSPDGPLTLLDAFEGRRQLMAYYAMWWPGHPAADQCEGCTWVITEVQELSYLHSRDITFAVFCQGRNVAFTAADDPYEESLRYREFMGWNHLPWYSAHASLDVLLVGREAGLFHVVCYLRDGDRVFETYWTNRRGAEVMDNNYALMDLTVYGRQEAWEDSPAGWPERGIAMRTADGPPNWQPLFQWPGGRPTAQWPRLAAGRSDDLGTDGPGRQPTPATSGGVDPRVRSSVVDSEGRRPVSALVCVSGSGHRRTLLAMLRSLARAWLATAGSWWRCSLRLRRRPSRRS